MSDFGPEYDAIMLRIAEEHSPLPGEQMDWDRCNELNVRRIRAVLDECYKAKIAKKHVLAADLAFSLHDLVCDFQHTMLLNMPEYTLDRELKARMAKITGHKAIFPEDN